MADIKEWFVYIVECGTKDLYVGIASDVAERVNRHNKGKASRYTKFRTPVKLIYTEKCLDYSAARKREREMKKYSRVKKLALVEKTMSY